MTAASRGGQRSVSEDRRDEAGDAGRAVPTSSPHVGEGVGRSYVARGLAWAWVALVSCVPTLGCGASNAQRGDEVDLGYTLGVAAKGARLAQDTRPTSCGAGAQPAIVGMNGTTPVWACLNACEPGDEYLTFVQILFEGGRRFAPSCAAVCPMGTHRLAYAVGYDQVGDSDNCADGADAAEGVEQAELARAWAAREDDALRRIDHALSALEGKAHLESDDGARIAEVKGWLRSILRRSHRRSPYPSDAAAERVGKDTVRIEALEGAWRQRQREVEAPARVAACKAECEQRACTSECRAINEAACVVCARSVGACRAGCE
jgi:hypothetical protein